jgi:hypothetical protein
MKSIVSISVIFIIGLFSIALADQEGVLGSDFPGDTVHNMLGVVFKNPFSVSLHLIDSTNGLIYGVGVPYIDSLNIYYSVIEIRKVDRTVRNDGLFPGHYIFVFRYSVENILEAANQYKQDHSVSSTDIYIEELSWQPKDVLFNRCDTSWPATNWNDTLPNWMTWYQYTWAQEMDQWALKNDGTSGDSCGCGVNERSLFTRTIISDRFPPNAYPNEYRIIKEAPTPDKPNYPEDIRMTDAWKFWYEHTNEDSLTDAPGDTSVKILFMDNGVEWKHVDLFGGLWNNPYEKNNFSSTPIFQPDVWRGDGGDKGDIIHENTGSQYPGYLNNDEDNDGYTDWHDPHIQYIMYNGIDDDHDGGRDRPPHPRQDTTDHTCDCPHALEGDTIPEGYENAGYILTTSDLGIEGVDDDSDGFIDECDGATWDDDENGYVDDVIGWSFSADNNKPMAYIDTTITGVSEFHHGTSTLSVVSAQINNVDPAGQYANQNEPVPFDSVRVGMAGICPDCRTIMVTGNAGDEAVSYAYSLGAKVITTSSSGFYGWGHSAKTAFDHGIVAVAAATNLPNCNPDSIKYYADDPYQLVVSSMTPNGECMASQLRSDVDISAPGCWVLGAASPRTYSWLNNPAENPGVNGFRWRTFWNRGCGTSMATPHVAGVAGLLFSYSKKNNLGWTNSDIIYRLLHGAKQYDDNYIGINLNGDTVHFGHYHRDSTNTPNYMPMGVGRLDANGALTLNMGSGAIGPLQHVYTYLKGLPYQGHRDSIVVKAFNHGTALSDAVFRLHLTDPYVSVFKDTSRVGTIGLFDDKDNSSNPFIIRISSTAPPGHVVNYSYSVTGTSYSSEYLNAGSFIIEFNTLFTPEIISDTVAQSYSVIGDINNDGFQELLLPCGNPNYYYLSARRLTDGSEIWRSHSYGDPFEIAIGDINGDLTNEIVLSNIGSQALVYVLDNSNGDPLTSLNLTYYGPQDTPPVLLDWDNDGDLEILIISGDHWTLLDYVNNNLQIIDTDGLGNYIHGAATGDIDGDGYPDLVFTCGAWGPPIAIYSQGTYLNLNTRYIQPGIGTAPVLGDIDNDGWLDVVIAPDFSYPLGEVVVFIHDIIDPSVIKDTILYDQISGVFGCDPSLGDVNNDGIPEIVFCKPTAYDDSTDYLYIGGDSLILNNWPRLIWNPRWNPSRMVFRQPLIADFNSDGYADILYKNNPYTFLFNHLANSVWSASESCRISSCTSFLSTNAFIGDFNNDNVLDYGAAFNSESGIGALDCRATNGTMSAGTLQWPQYQHDSRHTGLYAQPISQLTINNEMIMWDNSTVGDWIQVTSQGMLTIKPGCRIEFKSGAVLQVEGTLIAHGTPSEPIVFSGTVNEPGSWQGIIAFQDSRISLRNCIIEDGYYGVMAYDGEGSIINIDNCQLRNIGSIGGMFYDVDSLSVDSNSFVNCGYISMDLYKADSASITNNTIIGPNLIGIRIERSDGSSTTPTLVQGNYLRDFYSEDTLEGSVGIYIKESAYTQVLNNTVNFYDQVGIKLDYCDAILDHNIISDVNIAGIEFYNYSNPGHIRFNKIDHCEIGLVFNGNSHPFMGAIEPESAWGNNSIYKIDKYHVVNLNSDTTHISAIYNWWGEELIPIIDGQYVDWKPALEYNPLGKKGFLLSTLPTKYDLHQNYPNPFNTATIIKFDIVDHAQVKLDIYNILGQKVKSLINRPYSAGFHSIIWNGNNELGERVSSGVYIYTINAGEYHQARKMTILK